VNILRTSRVSSSSSPGASYIHAEESVPAASKTQRQVGLNASTVLGSQKVLRTSGTNNSSPVSVPAEQLVLAASKTRKQIGLKALEVQVHGQWKGVKKRVTVNRSSLFRASAGVLSTGGSIRNTIGKRDVGSHSHTLAPATVVGQNSTSILRDDSHNRTQTLFEIDNPNSNVTHMDNSHNIRMTHTSTGTHTNTVTHTSMAIHMDISHSSSETHTDNSSNDDVTFIHIMFIILEVFVAIGNIIVNGVVLSIMLEKNRLQPQNIYFIDLSVTGLLVGKCNPSHFSSLLQHSCSLFCSCYRPIAALPTFFFVL
jgi:hypothetical protein